MTDTQDLMAPAQDLLAPEVTPGEFQDAMARFPSGVVVVTARCEDGTPRGFTASSFCSVSLEPPLVLVCLADAADSSAVFAGCDHFAVSVLAPEHQGLALLFATKGADKFSDALLQPGPTGLPTVQQAPVQLDCAAYARYPAGDHTILIGRVTGVRLGEGAPMVYCERAFRTLN
ncbi:flavin reductase family protein [Streptomyces alanosinicus]|uniref:Actinorhodin polyketide dimerase n=1 Tax=Streptomyces alanosinicus TaxID=68171 RepID=A0A918YBT1_9ACTN|nr:flavin reductase family protein [Streptomyces alanosinicus]GHD98019.1 actinorhodin polyketide dimerase [Streptomyces alanosinicus]